MSTDRRQFMQGGLAAFVGLVAARLPLEAGAVPIGDAELEALEAIVAVTDEMTPALQRMAEATDRVRLSLEGCRDIAVPAIRRDIIDTYDDGYGFETHVVGLQRMDDLVLEFDPPFPSQDVLDLLVGRAEVDVDCRPAGLPMELRGILTKVERHFAPCMAREQERPATFVEIRSIGEVIWHA